jgi:hypothetical protein
MADLNEELHQIIKILTATINIESGRSAIRATAQASANGERWVRAGLRSDYPSSVTLRDR